MHSRRPSTGTGPVSTSGALQNEWRALYPVTWADFHRFLAGWAPSHSKVHRDTERMTRDALREP